VNWSLEDVAKAKAWLHEQRAVVHPGPIEVCKYALDVIEAQVGQRLKQAEEVLRAMAPEPVGTASPGQTFQPPFFGMDEDSNNVTLMFMEAGGVRTENMIHIWFESPDGDCSHLFNETQFRELYSGGCTLMGWNAIGHVVSDFNKKG